MEEEKCLTVANKTLFTLLADAEKCSGAVLTNLNTENFLHAKHYALVVQKHLQTVMDALEELAEESTEDSPTSLAGACEQAALYYGDFDETS